MKVTSRHISKPAVYVLGVALLLVVFLALWRLLLLVFTLESARAIPGSILLHSFVVGARFDFRTVSVLMAPLLLLAILPRLDIGRSRIMRRIHHGLTVLAAAVLFFLHVADIEFFKYFNTRLNGSALLWSDRPGDVVSMIWDTYPVGWYLLLWLAVLALFAWLLYRWQELTVGRRPASPLLTNLVWLVVPAVLFTTGGIGRIYEVSPFRWGLAYFSEYDFANQLALSPAYLFGRDVFYDAGKREQIAELVGQIEDPEATAITCELLGIEEGAGGAAGSRLTRPVRFERSGQAPPNVILIIMESFGSSKIGCLKSEYPYDLTPRFDSISAEGILFTNFYSSGTHTYSGLFTSLYGVPHLFGKVIMKQVGGHASVLGLPTILRRHRYTTHFFTTQDPHFDNMQGFLRANGVMDVCGLFDFDRSQEYSWLGVPDHVMFDTAFSRLRSRAESGRPFFATLLTGTHHAPWLFPEVSFERVPESEARAAELNSLKYSDWALGRFMEMVAHSPAFENTLVVVTADNGYRWKPCVDLDLSLLEIPLLLYDTDGRLPAGRSGRLGCQFDILPTVMGRVGLDYDNCSFGKDLLDTTAAGHDAVLSTRWYEVGYIEDGYYLVTHLNGGPDRLFRLAEKERNLIDSLPDLAALYKRRALALYQTAYHEVLKPLPPRLPGIAAGP